jgi:serine/threonine protein phosphatase PrpC
VKANASADLPEISGAVGTTLGEVRTENQDRAIIARYSPEGQRAFVLAVLCDGMGGMADGAKCAEFGLAALVTKLIYSPTVDTRMALRTAADAANSELYREFRGRGGTTVVAVLLTESDAAGLSVGDSRLYVRSKDARLKQISVDDTIAGELARIRGEAAPADDLEPFSQHLAQFVGMGENMDPRVYPLNNSGMDLYYMLTSDGAHSSPHAILESIICHSPSPHIGIGRLIHLANWRGGSDNATLVCISTDARPALRDQGRRAGVLEIWDSFTKLEFVVPATTTPSSSLPPLPLEAQTTNPELRSDEKRRRTKRKTPSPKTDAPNSEPQVRAGRVQRTLEIEIGTARIEEPAIHIGTANNTEQADNSVPEAKSPQPDTPQKPEKR